MSNGLETDGRYELGGEPSSHPLQVMSRAHQSFDANVQDLMTGQRSLNVDAEKRKSRSSSSFPPQRQVRELLRQKRILENPTIAEYAADENDET